MVDPRSTVNTARLAAFRDSFDGEIVLPEDALYDASRVVWNGMIDRRPAIVCRPSTPDDVVTAVRFARDNDLLVAVRGGGHSIPGFSTCDGGIVIDLARMGGASVDPERREARVGGGAHLAELDEEAQAVGLVCPVGVVAHTGVGGLTLGGGMGRLQRHLGLTIDSLLAVELVTADGRVMVVDEEKEPDLFWALRGAGANFGIATSFAFRLHPLSPMITHGSVIHPIERVGDLAALFREVAETGPDELTLTFGVGMAVPEEEFPAEVAGRTIAMLSVTHCGSPEAAERDLAPIRAVGSPVMDTIGVKTYLSVQHMNDEAMRWGHRFYMKSGFMASLPDEAIDLSTELVTDAPVDSGIGIWTWGRAIARVPEGDTAFCGRDAAFWIAAETLWDDPASDDANVDWGRDAMARLTPFTMAGRYVNDVVESGEEVVRSIYGDAKYERLLRLKRAWDPDNVFRLNQNLRP